MISNGTASLRPTSAARCRAVYPAFQVMVSQPTSKMCLMQSFRLCGSMVDSSTTSLTAEVRLCAQRFALSASTRARSTSASSVRISSCSCALSSCEAAKAASMEDWWQICPARCCCIATVTAEGPTSRAALAATVEDTMSAPAAAGVGDNDEEFAKAPDNRGGGGGPAGQGCPPHEGQGQLGVRAGSPCKRPSDLIMCLSVGGCCCDHCGGLCEP